MIEIPKKRAIKAWEQNAIDLGMTLCNETIQIFNSKLAAGELLLPVGSRAEMAVLLNIVVDASIAALVTCATYAANDTSEVYEEAIVGGIRDRFKYLRDVVREKKQ